MIAKEDKELTGQLKIVAKNRQGIKKFGNYDFSASTSAQGKTGNW